MCNLQRHCAIPKRSQPRVKLCVPQSTVKRTPDPKRQGHKMRYPREFSLGLSMILTMPPGVQVQDEGNCGESGW